MLVQATSGLTLPSMPLRTALAHGLETDSEQRRERMEGLIRALERSLG
jgi:hypothetical protein